MNVGWRNLRRRVAETTVTRTTGWDVLALIWAVATTFLAGVCWPAFVAIVIYPDQPELGRHLLLITAAGWLTLGLIWSIGRGRDG